MNCDTAIQCKREEISEQEEHRLQDENWITRVTRESPKFCRFIKKVSARVATASIIGLSLSCISIASSLIFAQVESTGASIFGN